MIRLKCLNLSNLQDYFTLKFIKKQYSVQVELLGSLLQEELTLMEYKVETKLENNKPSEKESPHSEGWAPRAVRGGRGVLLKRMILLYNSYFCHNHQTHPTPTRVSVAQRSEWIL
jgi:hypothetical protein